MTAEKAFTTEGLKEVTFAEGDTILAAETQTDRVYLLKAGTAVISREGHEISRVSEPLSIFGEISALLGCPHSATVKAGVECEFYVIEDLDAYCEQNPEAALLISRILARRLVNMNDYFSEFKNELQAMESLNSEMAFAKKISNLVLRLDRFWGQEVFATKPR